MFKTHRAAAPIAATVLALAALAHAPAAHAISFSFAQTGFADGASVTGSFIGEDENQDGWLYAYELSDFEFHFSGNRAVEAFTHGMANRAGLEFHIAEQRIAHLATNGPDETRFLAYDAFGWPGFDIPGRVTDNRTGMSSISWDRLQVTPVPEPASLSMLLSGLVAVGRLARRRLAAMA